MRSSSTFARIVCLWLLSVGGARADSIADTLRAAQQQCPQPDCECKAVGGKVQCTFHVDTASIYRTLVTNRGLGALKKVEEVKSAPKAAETKTAAPVASAKTDASKVKELKLDQLPQKLLDEGEKMMCPICVKLFRIAAPIIKSSKKNMNDEILDIACKALGLAQPLGMLCQIVGKRVMDAVMQKTGAKDKEDAAVQEMFQKFLPSPHGICEEMKLCGPCKAKSK